MKVMESLHARARLAIVCATRRELVETVNQAKFTAYIRGHREGLAACVGGRVANVNSTRNATVIGSMSSEWKTSE